MSKRLINTTYLIRRKQCVQTFSVFDFLNDIVSKVPDLGGSIATGDDQTVPKRRFVFVTLFWFTALNFWSSSVY
jgi:hypothetical protein